MSSRKRIYIYENGKKIPYDSANLEVIFKKLALFGDDTHAPEISATEISSGVWGIDCGGAILRNVGSAQGDTDVVNKSEAGMPAGIICPYAGTTAPPGWKMCDGNAFLKTEYPALWAAIGTTWDNGARQDGTGGTYSTPTTGYFRLPDLRGTFLRGVGTSAKTDGSGDVSITLAGFSNDSFAEHSHLKSDNLGQGAGPTNPNSQYAAVANNSDGVISASTVWKVGGTETAPRYTGINYIIKT